MEKSKITWWSAIVIVVVSVVIAGLMTRFLSTDFSTIDIFAPIEKRVDFTITDIYNAVMENMTEREISQDVIVISTDSCDRDGIADAIRKVSDLGAKAIGLDIEFLVPEEDNANLLSAVLYTDNLVNATSIARVNDSIFERKPLSFFEEEFIDDLKYVGYVNLNASYSWNVVRTFRPYVLVGEDTVPSMSLALAQVANKECVSKLLERNEKYTIIDFTSKQIKTISAHRLDSLDIADQIKNRVVLLGDTKTTKDLYLTPLHDPVPGVLIHAYALQTILDTSFIEVSKEWQDWTRAILICIILVSILLLANTINIEMLKYIINISVRLLLLFFMYRLVIRGCRAYVDSHMYVDYTISVLMLGFGTLAFDIVYAIYGLIILIVQGIKQKQNKK